MAQDHVHCCRRIAAGSDIVWAYLRDFCAPWHPAIARMDPEDGGRIRAFSVCGEQTVYREQLTWFSDSDQVMAYRHLQGIEGAQRYEGRLSVAASEQGGSTVTMRADIEAPADRIDAIASGTRAVFDAGLAALAEHPFAEASAAEKHDDPVSIRARVIDGTPQLAISETPKRGGPLCLFLHGIGGARQNWDLQMRHAGHHMQCAAMDLRGYGDSTLGPSWSRVEDYCDDILRVRDALGADQLVLCGLSYGAWIATSFAEAYPDLLSGLVLAGGCTGMSEAPQQRREAFLASRDIPLTKGQTPADFASDVIDAIVGPNASELAKQSLFSSMARIPSDTYRDALRCFTNPPKVFDFSLLTMPVLMMTGEYDKLAPPSEIRSVARRIHQTVRMPDVRFETIIGAGHVCNVEAPDRFNALLAEFMGKVAR